MKYLKLLILAFIVWIGFSHYLSAQNGVFDRYYTSFFQTRLFTNPAYTGFEAQGNIHLFTQQYFFADADASQQSYVLAYDGRLGESHNLGGMFFFDRYAFENSNMTQLNLQIPYAFRIKLGERKKLSLGASPYFNYFRSDFVSAGMGNIRDFTYAGTSIGAWLKINGFFAGLSGAMSYRLSEQPTNDDRFQYQYTYFQIGYRIPYEGISITPIVHYRSVHSYKDITPVLLDMGFLAGFLEDKLQAGYIHSFPVDEQTNYYWGAFTLALNVAKKLTLSANYRIPRSSATGLSQNVLEFNVNYRFGEVDED